MKNSQWALAFSATVALSGPTQDQDKLKDSSDIFPEDDATGTFPGDSMQELIDRFLRDLKKSQPEKPCIVNPV